MDTSGNDCPLDVVLIGLEPLLNGILQSFSKTIYFFLITIKSTFFFCYMWLMNELKFDFLLISAFFAPRRYSTPYKTILLNLNVCRLSSFTELTLVGKSFCVKTKEAKRLQMVYDLNEFSIFTKLTQPQRNEARKLSRFF